MSSITPFDVVKVNGVKVSNKKVDDRYLSRSITRMFASWKFSKRGDDFNRNYARSTKCSRLASNQPDNIAGGATREGCADIFVEGEVRCMKMKSRE